LKRTQLTGWIVLAIVVATTVAYLPLFDNDFVNYDDDLYILNNMHIQHGLDAETFRWAFTTFRGANWFPLTWLSWATDFVLFGRDPAGFHLTSLVLHAANAVLLFLVFLRLTAQPWRCAFVALIFALHPLHVESVVWAAARKDVLSGLFAMLTLLAYVQFVRRGRRFYPFVFAFLALGLMAKPTLVTWPFVLLLLDFWPLQRFSRQGIDASLLRTVVVEKLPLFALVAVASAVTVESQSYWGTVQNLNVFPVGLRIENAVTAYVDYTRDAFWPVGLSVFYPHPGRTLTATHVAAASAALAGVTALALYLWRRRPEVAVGWFWFIGVMIPVIGLVQVGQAARADRYTYLPLIGLSLPIVWAAASLAARNRTMRALVGALGVAAIAALGVGTNAQVRHWQDSESLFRHALSVTKRNHVAHINLGVVLHNGDEHERAARHLELALRIAPSSPTALGVLGDVRVATGRAEESLALYRKALKREPDSLRWHEGLGNALLDLDRPQDALRSYRRALEIKSKGAHLHGNLGLAYQRLGRADEAVASFEEALRLNPALAEVHGNFGAVLVEIGSDERAIEHFQRAVELDPSLALIHGHLGKLQADRGDVESGLRHLGEAVRLDSENGRLQAAYARVLAVAGQHDDSIAHYRSAMAHGEHSVPVYVGLARQLLDVGRIAQARSFADMAVSATDRSVPAVLMLLAEAHAAGGDFDTAARIADEAAGVAEKAGSLDRSASIRRRAATYRDGRIP